MDNKSELCRRRICTSWNGCDEYLRDCIERSKYVQKVRKELKTKEHKNRDYN
ncbi:MAG: hypothetical protein P8Y70_09970 [Candidatus Lokiarchaeota archaeon]